MIAITPVRRGIVAGFPKKQCRYGFKQTITVLYTMGIPSYFSHIVREHRDTIKELPEDFVADNLYLDSNSIIYECVHATPMQKMKTIDYEHLIIKQVCAKICEHIETIRPRNRLIIAFDGVAPVAKLDQQRERRYKSWMQARLLNRDTEEWNTCAITPGTTFMAALNRSVRSYFSGRKEYKGLRITTSPSDEEGEGEHKIYAAIRAEPSYHQKTTTVIYGLDADLIMLTLNHLSLAPRLFLYRETPHFIKSIDSTLEPNRSYVIDIPRFADHLQDNLGNRINAPTVGFEVVSDYVFLCFLLGNDFLPHFPSLNIRTTGIDTLMNAYAKCRKIKGFQLVDAQLPKVNWRCFRQLVMTLAEGEYEALQAEHDLRDKRSKVGYRPRPGDDPQEQRLMNIPVRERAVELFIDPSEEGWEWRYYKSLFDLDITDARRKEICTNYLEGLEWTLAYYTTGCKSWSWSYKYHYPPLLSDLCKYVPYFDTTFVECDSSRAVPPLVQLSYVLPRAYMNLLPNAVFRSLLHHCPEWYDDSGGFLWAYCRYFWESHAILPHIDIGELETLVAACP